MSPTRRAVQLLLGLLAYALSMVMLLHAGQGGMPWDVLHQGVVLRTGLPFGVVVGSLSVLALLAWIPLRQRPGIGTIANVVVITLTIDPAIALVTRLVPDPGVAASVALAVGGIVLNGLATSAYLGVRLGPGPRDGLMTGLVARTGWSVRLVRTLIEVVVVSLGWVLGGTLGWATIAYALGVGPIVQLTARWFAPRGLAGPRPARARARRRAHVGTEPREPVAATTGPRPDEGGMPEPGR
ncbi:YitT family protein [Cellulosimicrobium sp. NPDC057862]|uniref:membrane protein YczE n=1 Tax=Cellulosimicrobium sp. NPDC057862 TaxID=3346266 RepID=UPI00366C54E3